MTDPKIKFDENRIAAQNHGMGIGITEQRKKETKKGSKRNERKSKSD